MSKIDIIIAEDNNVLNSLIKRGVKCFNVVKNKDNITFKIEAKNINIARRILNSSKINFDIKQNKKHYIEYVQIFIYIFIYVAFLFFNINDSKKIDKIEVVSSNIILSTNVREYLELNIKLPIKKEKLNIEKIEYDIISKYENVAFCQITNKGKSLIVDITSINIDNPSNSNAKRIVSSSSAIITKVLLSGGSSVVKSGDIVKKGDLLIDGKIPSKQEEDTFIDVNAKGVVYGIVFYEKHFCVPKNEIKISRGKLIKSIYTISIGNFKINIGKKIKNKNAFELSTKKHINSVLPICITKTNQYERKTDTYNNLDEDIEELVLNKKQEILEDIPPKSEILREFVNKKEIDNIIYLDIYYEVEQCISIEEE